PTISSATALTFAVPGAASSGRIVASNASGSGTSAQDFIVPPAGVNTADIVSTARVGAGGSSGSVAVYAPNKHALVLFDGAANIYYTLQLPQLAIAPTNANVTYKVIKPDNSVLVTGQVGTGTNRPTIHLPKLPVAGTYSVLLSPGLATLNTSARLVADPVLAIDGAAAASGLDFAGQSARWVFDATAGQRIGIGGSGTTVTPTGATSTVTFSVYQPDGSSLAGFTHVSPCSATANPQGNCDAEMLAAGAGTYSILGVPNSITAYTNLSVQVSSEATGTLVVDTASDVTLARVGQDSRHTFTASAGDSIGVDLFGISPTPQAQSFAYTVSKPDGTALINCSAAWPAYASLCELGTLATAGTYAVTIDPSWGTYGTFKLAAKAGALLTTSGTPTPFSAAAVAETMRLRISGTAGQRLTVAVTGLTYTGGASSSASTLTVFKPDRAQLVTGWTCWPTIAGGSCKVTLPALPTSGSYGVAVSPPSGVRISGNVSLSEDLAGTLVSGTAQTVTASRAGQNARYTFSGTAGDNVAVKLFGASTVPASQDIALRLFRPDGVLLASANTSATAAIVQSFALPSTGTYSVTVEPTYGTTWQGQLMLDPGPLLAIDGTMASLATSAAGEPLRYRFTGTAGQRLEFGLSGLTYAAASSSATSFGLYRPDGTAISILSCLTSGAGACETVVASLPSTGTYVALFTPPPASSITAGTAAFSTAASGTVVVGDPAQTIAVSRPGQTARYTFSGTSGQLLRLNWTGAVVGSSATVAVSILKPDGSTLSSSSFVNGANGGLDIASLPSSGTFTVVLDPSNAATFSASAALATR
ncbi:MAG: pre-peptidase C-terminal domain-containing protein, partial [Chloroflexota bacterium]